MNTNASARTSVGKKVLRYTLATVILVTAPFILFGFFENRLIYFPEKALLTTPDEMGLSYEDVRITAPDGVALHGWFIPAASAEPPLAHVLFLHGNAGNISHFLEKTAPLVKQGLSVFMLDYRGFGLSQGRPGEQGLFLDARTAYDYLTSRPGVSPDQVIIHGFSLGGGVASELALTAPARALIMESTFTSIRDMAHTMIPILPRFLVSPLFQSLDKMPRLALPTFFIHGDRDQTVPHWMGRKLYEAHPGPKRLYIVPGAGHTDTDLIGGSEYYRRLLDFIRHPSQEGIIS